MTDPFGAGQFEALVEERALAKANQETDRRNKAQAERHINRANIENRNKALLSKILNIFFDNQFGFDYGNKEERKEILGLRLLSKSCREIVDKYFFEDNTNYECYPFLQGSNAEYRTLSLKGLDDITRATSILSKMSESERQPFLRRVKVIEPSGPRENSEDKFLGFNIGVGIFLHLFGDKVYDFDLRLECFTGREMYSLVQSFVSVMPCLKALAISGWPTYYGQCQEQDLTLEIKEFPFPSLPSLRICHVFGCSKLHRIILSTILLENPWILRTRLECANQVNAFNDLPQFFYPTSVYIDAYSIPPVLIIYTWPLKELVLNIAPFLIDGIKASELFPLLEKFKDTLVDLAIFNVILEEDQNQEGNYLNLPNLKRLHVSLHNGFHKVDFMLPMKSLEKLEVKICPGLNRDGQLEEGPCCSSCGLWFRIDETEKVKLKGMLFELERSNITQIFPSLKSLGIQSFKPWNLIIKYYREKNELKRRALVENAIETTTSEMMIELNKEELQLFVERQMSVC